MTKIKICGLRRKVDLEYVNEVKPDYIGFVFAPSKRQVSQEQAYRLKELLDPQIQAVGVFTDQSAAQIGEAAKSGTIDMIQLHGPPNNQVIAQVKELTGLLVIQAFGIAGPEDLKQASQSEADMILLDYPGGGKGKTFQWDLLNTDSALQGRRFFLAGGINSENVRPAIEGFHPYGVDVSSGVETEGYKDKEKIAELVRRVRDVKGQIW